MEVMFIEIAGFLNTSLESVSKSTIGYFLVPRFENELSFKTFRNKMSLICKKMNCRRNTCSFEGFSHTSTKQFENGLL